MLSPVIEWWGKCVPWEATWLQHLAVNVSDDDCKDYGVEWTILSMLDYLPKENDKLMSFKLWCDHKASITTLKDSLISCRHWTTSLKIKQKFNCVGRLITVSSEFIDTINSYVQGHWWERVVGTGSLRSWSSLRLRHVFCGRLPFPLWHWLVSVETIGPWMFSRPSPRVRVLYSTGTPAAVNFCFFQGRRDHGPPQWSKDFAL